MAFNKLQLECRLVQVENSKRIVKVFENTFRYAVINVGIEIKEAYWTGDKITVFLTDGKVRRYTSLSVWENLRN
jgi:hypothetical protein